MPAPAMMMSTSLEAPPISLVFPRRESDSAGSFIEVPWDRSEDRRGSLTRELRKVKLPKRNRPSTATVMSNGSSSSYGGSSRGGSGTDASLFGIDAAKRQAVASLSMEPGSPSSSRRSSLDDNAFAQFARFEERRAFEAKTAKSTTPKFRMPFSKWSRSHKETPMSPLLSSDIAPDEPSYRSGGLAIDLGPRDAGASPRLDTKLRARSIEDAVESLGWYWNSKADAIWGPAQKENSAHNQPPFMGRSMSVVDLTTSAKSLLPPSVQRLAGKAHRSKSDAAESFKSWDDYLEAYAAGSFDISEASRQPRVEGHRPVDGHLAAPMPDWELSRKLAICRAGVFDLPPSLLRKIDAIAMRIKEALDMEITYVDVLLGDEGYLILSDQVKHHLSCRRDTMCAHTILNSQRGFTVLDRHQDWRFKDNPLLSHISFYSGYPIRSGTGLPFGALCVMDSRPRRHFSQEDKDLIRQAAEAVSRILEDNFANRFEAKMNLMSQTFEAVKASVRHCTLDTTAWRGPTPELKLVESALSQTRECMQLDAAYIVAVRDDAAQVVASAGGPVPSRVSTQAGFYSAVQRQEAGYLIYQNEFLDRAGHSELVALAPLDGPQYSCGIMMSLPSPPSQPAGSTSSSRDSQASPATTLVSLSSNASVDFVLVTASTQPRHVLGVEDLRFLQSIKPFLAAALRQVNLPPFPVVDAVGPLLEATAKVQLSHKGDTTASPKPGRRSNNAALHPSSASKRWSPPEGGGSPAKTASPRPRSRSEHPFASTSSDSQPQFSYAVDALPPVPPRAASTIARSPQTGDYYFRIGASRPSTAVSQPPPLLPTPRRPASSKGERPPPSSDSRPSSARGLGRQMVNGVMKGSLSSIGGADGGRRSNKAVPTAQDSSSVEFLALPPQSFMTAATKTEDGPSSNPGSYPASPKYRFCQDCAGILPLLPASTPPRHDADGRSQRPSFSSSPSSPTFSSLARLPLSTSPPPPRSQPLQVSKSSAGAPSPTTPSKTLHPGNIVCTCPSSNGAGTWTPKNPALSIPTAVHEGQRLDEWTAPQHHQTPQAASLDLPSTSPHAGSASLASSFGFSLPGGSATSLLLPGSLSGSVDSSSGGVNGLAPAPRASRRLSSGGGLAPRPPKARTAKATRRPQTASEATATTSAGRDNGVPLSPRARQQSATDAF